MFKESISIQVEVMESIIFEDVDQIGTNQSYEYLGGWFPVFVELIASNKSSNQIIKGLNMDSNSKIIGTKHEYNFKKGDKIRFYGNEEYKIKSVKEVIDPAHTNTVRMFPNSQRLYTWKIIELGG